MSKKNPLTGLTILEFGSQRDATKFSQSFSRFPGIGNIQQDKEILGIYGPKKSTRQTVRGSLLFGGKGTSSSSFYGFGAKKSAQRLGSALERQGRLRYDNLRKQIKKQRPPIPKLAFESAREKERYRPKQRFLFSKESFGFAPEAKIPLSLQKDISALQRVADRDVGQEPARYIPPTFQRNVYSSVYGTSKNPTGQLSDKAYRYYERNVEGKGMRWFKTVNTAWVAEQQRIHDSGKDADPGFYAYREDIGRALTPPSVKKEIEKSKIEISKFEMRKKGFEDTLQKVGSNISEAADLPSRKEFRRSGELSGDLKGAEVSGRRQTALAISRIGTGRGPGSGGYTRLTLIAEGRIKVGKTPREQRDIQNLAILRLSQLGVPDAQQRIKVLTSQRGKEEIRRLESIGSEKRPFSDIELTKGQKQQLYLQRRTSEQSRFVKPRRLT